MEEKIFSVTKYGKKLSKKLYTWDEEARTFSTLEDDLVLDFDGINNCTFKTGSDCTFKTGSDCTFKTGSYCTFDTGSYCTFDTGSDCTFKTGSYCTFKTGFNCTFKTGSDCTFKTGFNCTFDTGSYCTFKTGSDCTFKTGSDCTFKTGFNCVLVRRDIFEFYDISNKQIQTCPIEIKGYIENGFYYVNDEKQYKAIIVDNILSEVINHRGNVYKVKNYGEDKISYIVQDGDIYSHGATIKEARESLIYKISNRDTSIYNDVKLDDEFELKDIIKMYRVITGACEAGTRYFVENNKLPNKLTVKQTIDLTKGQYGNEKFKKFFEEKR